MPSPYTLADTLYNTLSLMKPIRTSPVQVEAIEMWLQLFLRDANWGKKIVSKLMDFFLLLVGVLIISSIFLLSFSQSI
jgi:hypothetical protein